MTQAIKAKKYNVDSKLFETFLHLNLHDIAVNKPSKARSDKKFKKDMTVMSKKERKRKKSIIKLQRELKEVEAEESNEKRTKMVRIYVSFITGQYIPLIFYCSKLKY